MKILQIKYLQNLKKNDLFSNWSKYNWKLWNKKKHEVKQKKKTQHA